MTVLRYMNLNKFIFERSFSFKLRYVICSDDLNILSIAHSVNRLFEDLNVFLRILNRRFRKRFFVLVSYNLFILNAVQGLDSNQYRPSRLSSILGNIMV